MKFKKYITEAEIQPEVNEPAQDTAMFTGIISNLVKDEWEAIDGYNNAIIALSDGGYEVVIDNLNDIVSEEYVHIGQLEKLLQMAIPEATNMEEGEAEVTDQEVEEGAIFDKVTGIDDAKNLVKGVSSIASELSEGKVAAVTAAAKFVLNNKEQIIDGLKELGIAANDIDKELVEIIQRHRTLLKGESLEEDSHNSYAMPAGSKKDAYNNALKYAKKNDCPYAYGYTKSGKFFAFEQPVKCTGDPTECEAKLRAKYKASTVAFVYADQGFREDLDEEFKIVSDIWNFQPWSGAVETFNKIKDADMLDELDLYLEMMYPDGLTETELNDVLRFDADDLLDELGLGEEEVEEACENCEVEEACENCEDDIPQEVVDKIEFKEEE